MNLGKQRKMMILLCDQKYVQAVFSIVVYQQESVFRIMRKRRWASEVKTLNSQSHLTSFIVQLCEKPLVDQNPFVSL